MNNSSSKSLQNLNNKLHKPLVIKDRQNIICNKLSDSSSLKISDLFIKKNINLNNCLKIFNEFYPTIKSINNKNLIINAENSKIVLNENTCITNNCLQFTNNFKAMNNKIILGKNICFYDNVPKLGLSSISTKEQFRGFEFLWVDESNSNKTGFFGFNSIKNRFTIIPCSNNNNKQFQGNIGDCEFNNIYSNKIINGITKINSNYIENIENYSSIIFEENHIMSSCNDTSINMAMSGDDNIIDLDNLKRIYIIRTINTNLLINLPVVSNNDLEGINFTIKHLAPNGTITINGFNENEGSSGQIILNKGDNINCLIVSNESSLEWISF